MVKKRFFVEERDFDALGPLDWIHVLSDPDIEFLGYGAEEIEETRESVLTALRKGNNAVLYHLWRRIDSRNDSFEEEYKEFDELEDVLND
jgi:hypothetical protein